MANSTSLLSPRDSRQARTWAVSASSKGKAPRFWARARRMEIRLKASTWGSAKRQGASFS